MPPRIVCPNCQQNEWLENEGLNYLPRVSKMNNGKYVTYTENEFMLNCGDAIIACMPYIFGNLIDSYYDYRKSMSEIF